LGSKVHFTEQIRSDTCVDEAGAPAPFEESADLRCFTHVMRRFELEESASLVCDEGREGHGLGYEQVLDGAGAADLLVNISGHMTLEPILRRVRRKASIATSRVVWLRRRAIARHGGPHHNLLVAARTRNLARSARG